MKLAKLVSAIAVLTTSLIASSPSNAQSEAQADRFALCRSVMELRQYDKTRDGPKPKKTNSLGMGWYPPPGLGADVEEDVENRNTGIWRFQECSSIPGIYNPSQLTYLGEAKVFDPPSNVRATPNGAILCSVTSTGKIPIQGKDGVWYRTDYCGSPGYIHKSQVKF